MSVKYVTEKAQFWSKIQICKDFDRAPIRTMTGIYLTEFGNIDQINKKKTLEF